MKTLDCHYEGSSNKTQIFDLTETLLQLWIKRAGRVYINLQRWATT